MSKYVVWVDNVVPSPNIKATECERSKRTLNKVGPRTKSREARPPYGEIVSQK